MAAGMVVGGLALGPSTSLAAEEVDFFYEDFEHLELTRWDNTYNWSLVGASADSDGKKSRGYGNAEQLSSITKSISTVCYDQLGLSFQYRISGFEGVDVAKVIVQAGSEFSWVSLASYGQNTDGWQQATVSIPSQFAGRSNFGFGFMVEANAADDMFYVDNIRLHGLEVECLENSEAYVEQYDEVEGVNENQNETENESENDSSLSDDDQEDQDDEVVGVSDRSDSDDQTTSSEDGEALSSGSNNGGNNQGAESLVLASVNQLPSPVSGSTLPLTGGSGMAWIGASLSLAGLLVRRISQSL